MACGREFAEEETYFSALYDWDESFERKDFCSGCWEKQIRDSLFSFWRTRRPRKDQASRRMVDDSVVYDFFQRLGDEGGESRLAFRYVMALYLMRRRLMKIVDIRRGDAGETLVFKNRKDGAQYDVLNPDLTETQVGEVSAKLMTMLDMDIG